MMDRGFIGIDAPGQTRWQLPSAQRAREGEAPKAGTDLKSVPSREGATRAPTMDRAG
jgi:hypothetical protein